MQGYVTLDKPLGHTPLETVEALRLLHPEYENTPLSYAGRLDPMAEGKLLVLIGEECKQKKRYEGLDKEYVIEVLIGIGSDTGDVLGIPERGTTVLPTESQIRTVLRQEVGTHTVPYPAFSSKTVHGKPLFLHALEKTLDSITIPEHPETIYSAELISTRVCTSTEVLSYVFTRIKLPTFDPDPRKTLGADFRRSDIRSGWEKMLTNESQTYVVAEIRVTAGSGTYMRSLAGRIGAALGSKALAFSIRRTRIGRYLRLGPIGWWLRQY